MENNSQEKTSVQYFSINHLIIEKSDIDIFISTITSEKSSIEELFDNGIPIYPEAAKKFAVLTGLQFVHKNTVGNVCYATNNEDMRDEFKQVFDITDILHYIYGSLLEEGKNKLRQDTSPVADQQIPYPESSEKFWELARKGKDSLNRKV